jgi:hypothetical protein
VRLEIQIAENPNWIVTQTTCLSRKENTRNTYDDFICRGDTGNSKRQCVICGDNLMNSSLKPFSLRPHLEIGHRRQ